MCFDGEKFYLVIEVEMVMGSISLDGVANGGNE